MINQISEDTISTASLNAENETKQGLKSRKLSGKTFDFFRKRDSRRENAIKKEENQGKREDLIEVKIVECKLKNAPTTKMSFDIFKNIKKHMQFKSLSICKSKQKAKEIEASTAMSVTNQVLSTCQSDSTTIATQGNNVFGSNDNELPTCSNVSCSNEDSTKLLTQSDSSKLSDNMLHNCSDKEIEELLKEQSNEKPNVDYNEKTVDAECQSFSTNERQEVVQSTSTKNAEGEQSSDKVEECKEAECDICEEMLTDNKVKASLAEELLKLSKYGWYWGPISGNEADSKLISEPDGAFLVRDSSDDRYVLTLSFKSSGKLLHARMEHTGGLFSLCNQSETEGFTSVADLINDSMNCSQSAVFCYARPKYPGYPSFAVRLTKPVSRFTQVRSLQYLCRFVIRQNTRLDNIHKLPLPKTIKGYIEEAHY